MKYSVKSIEESWEVEADYYKIIQRKQVGVDGPYDQTIIFHKEDYDVTRNENVITRTVFHFPHNDEFLVSPVTDVGDK